MDSGNAALTELTALIQLVCARDISVYDEDFLVKSLDKRLAETGHKTLQASCAFLREKPAEGELLFSSLGISYSEFFRNPLTFSVLEQLVLPALISELKRTGRKELRVWSAGCAAGQEAYSLAILLAELAAQRENSFPFRIFATDSSETGLAAARTGGYDGAALKNVRLEHLDKYFLQQGGAYALKSEIKNHVDFSAYDLVADKLVCPPDSIYGDFDLVFCGNLLFYYRPEIRRELLFKIYDCLTPGGYLATGEAEREIVVQSGFRAIFPPAPVFKTQQR